MTDIPADDAVPRARIPYLNEPQRDLAGWVRYFSKAEIPVLATTSAAIEELRAIEDDVDAKMLGSVIESDPFMTIKVMADVAEQPFGELVETFRQGPPPWALPWAVPLLGERLAARDDDDLLRRLAFGELGHLGAGGGGAPDCNAKPDRARQI